MDVEQIRARLAVPARPAAPSPPPAAIAQPPAPIGVPVASDDARDLISGPAMPAAVLVPFVFGASPGVLLTKRNERLSHHAGQVSFPGGRIEPQDATPEATALRETEEEIGLDPARVEVIGRLPDYLTGTGFCITPVLGLVEPAEGGLAGLNLRLSPAEVEAVFALPLAVLLDPKAPQRKRALWRGRWREFWVWPHPEHYVWGATAGILVNLAARLRGG